MGIEERTIAAAQDFAAFDEDALLVVLGKQEKEIEKDPSLAADPTLNPAYDSTQMGIADLKALGARILSRWNKELHRLVCQAGDDVERKRLLDALNLGEAAAIAAVASLLLAIAPAAVAAPAAALIVKRFLEPAKEELCAAWSEMIELEA
ncbi:hypothetical protein SAMN06265365_105207 [Tistlia consotensis]|uniref:Uncharacterized protein n=1 Tax=Tistlia consotensis USBA 355 TaxID=560819 RepID=A0A1Y6BI51_9PROT|nr:hypothetical protein [Tistlia consotensis]SMF12484.1 hypothetical protein SAMN05428998_10591 [Tistlia consotensis USBA 355]SNR51075.1 hypothetical protein SAMN06265365_105207 [Tistlia consotensis]